MPFNDIIAALFEISESLPLPIVITLGIPSLFTIYAALIQRSSQSGKMPFDIQTLLWTFDSCVVPDNDSDADE